MNKYLKGCITILLVIIIFIILICGYFYYNISTSRERNETDDFKCSNTQYIIDNPEIQITDSTATHNIQKITIILLQDSKELDSINIDNHSKDKIAFKFPFKRALITSKIIVKTKQNQFLIENMTYFNDGKWGMFGYLGKDCQFSYEYKKL